MAQKEYNISLKLNALLGKDYSKNFAQAQKELEQTKKDIAELNKVQSDVAAYSKQQESIDLTARKLEDLQQQYDNIQREIQETEGFSSSLENKLISKQAAIDKTTASLEKQKLKLNEQSAALREAGVDTEKLAAESDRLEKEMQELAEATAEAAKAVEDFDDKSVNAFEAVGDAAVAAGISKILKEWKDDYIECVTLAADFQEQMSTVEALSGANRSELSDLSALAKELGATTKFTAKQSAEAMSFMAMAGWDSQEMISGMDGVMQLAAASGEDLARVSDIVTDNLTAFGLKASDTARFADVLAAAATNSNTSVSVMGETFKNSAALAGALGYSVEDVAVAVGLMANAGIKGSNAGTTLKNVFNGLLEGVTLTSEAFGEVEYSAINADGTMKSFGETINDLREYFSQMTGAEQLQNAETIAGQRAMAGFVSVLNATDDDIQKLTSSITNSAGAAQKMADIKLDNLNGQLTLLNSAADAVKTTVGEAYQNEFQSIAKIGAEILSEINEFLVAHPQMLRFLIALSAEIGVIVAAYGAYKGIKSAMAAVQLLNIALSKKEAIAETEKAAATTAEAAATGAATAAQMGLNAAMAANPIGLVITAVATLTIGIAALASYMGDAAEESTRMTYASQKQREEIENLNAEYEEACKLYGETSYQAQELKQDIDDLTASYVANAQTMEDFLSGIESDIAAHKEWVENYRSEVEQIDKENGSVTSLINRLDTLTSSSKTAADSQAEIESIIRILNSQIPDLALSYDSLTNSLSTSTEAIIANAEARAKANQYQANKDALDKAVIDKMTFEKEKVALEAEREAAQEAYDLAKANAEALGKSLAKSGARNASQSYANSDVKKELDATSASLKALDESLAAVNESAEENDKLIEQLSGDVYEYEKSLIAANEAAEELSEEGLANLQKALKLVQTGDIDIDTAAKLFGVDVDLLQSSSDAVTQYRKDIEDAITAVKNGWLTAKEAAEIYGVTVDSINTVTQVDEAIYSLDRLATAYNEARDAAEKSVQGQYDIWDEAAVVIVTSIEDINKALETQTSYWFDYNKDLGDLLERAEDIDGLREIVAQFADGSTDSVNAVAGLAKASDSELREFVDNYRKMVEQQSEVIDTLTDYSGLEEGIAECQQLLENAVDDMNLDEEAAQAAKSTIEAYVDALRLGTDDAVAEANRLKSLVELALYNDSISDKPANSGRNTVVPRGYRSLLDADLNAYAVGTNDAKAGAALVGELGPELVTFGGGEHVYTSDETEKLLSFAMLPQLAEYFNAVKQSREASIAPTEIDAKPSYAQPVQITVSPSFTVEGTSQDEDIEDRLRQFSDELVDMVKDAIEEAGIDIKRGAYE